MESKGTVLYIGGFELPDKNAAAQRVVGIAKGLKDLGYEVVFLNSVKGLKKHSIAKKKYFGFNCYEYGRENDLDYMILAETTLKMIKRIAPQKIIAYNYPAISLFKILMYCRSNKIICYGDVSEWYKDESKKIIYRIIKNFDTFLRMKFVNKKLNGVIAISRYLFNYYRKFTKTVLIPPTVDIFDKKWLSENDNIDENSFVYAGSPSAQKERLDYIINAFQNIQDKQKAKLNVLGITEEEFRKMYSYKGTISSAIIFWGRVDHQSVLDVIKHSKASIIIRTNNSVVKAGFPTKLVESISCKTPVIANRFSNVSEYLSKNNSMLFDEKGRLETCLIKACKMNKEVDNSLFDYRNYMSELEELLS